MGKLHRKLLAVYEERPGTLRADVLAAVVAGLAAALETRLASRMTVIEVMPGWSVKRRRKTGTSCNGGEHGIR